MSARLVLEQINRSLSTSGPHSTGTFQGLQLESRFQPIVSLAHRRVIGYEALLRGYTQDGVSVPALEIFGSVAHGNEAVRLDRVCRALHVRNFHKALDRDVWLFLNISPSAIHDGPSTGDFFASLLRDHGIEPGRIVVEILESAIGSEDTLARAVDYYRSMGCLIAVDDFGIGSSNLERIWRIRPEIVKLDRSMTVAATQNKRLRRLMENVVSLLHEAGSLVLLEGIENAEDALIAMESDADFIQGHFLSFPTPKPEMHDVCHGLEPLCHGFREAARAHYDRENRLLEMHRVQFQQAVELLRSGADMDRACCTLRNAPDVRRCYLLSADGTQVGSNVEMCADSDPRYAPIADARGASWFRRSYFRRAISNVGVLQQTRPYLSLTGARMCITLSIAFQSRGGALQVLCCDLDGTE